MNFANDSNKSSFISLNNNMVFSDSNPNIPDFYKMIEIEKQRRLVYKPKLYY